MPTTVQMLRGYPELVLEAMAELRGAFLESAEIPEQKIELLAAQISEPTSVQMAFDELAEADPQVQEAIDLLMREGGEMGSAQFSREYGGIRRMGPAKLERETPWLFPESIAELLYYYGLIGISFAGAGPSAQRIIYIPSDVSPWLPHPQNPALENGLGVQPVAPPPAARLLLADDSFLEDAGSLLGFLHTDKLRLTAQGPNPEDIDRFVERLQTPFGDDADLDTRLALLLHLANRLGWLRRSEDNIVELTGNRVRMFLDRTRAEQRRMLWDAWCESPEWNDLCRTPSLECTRAGNWSNDPLQTRRAVLQMVAGLQPGAWYSQSEVLHAIQNAEPDFQRPTGEYDTWYIRSTTTQEFLKGFDQWDAVEGELLRFLLRGPLHWLQAVDLAEPSAGDDYSVSLSQWGAHWLVEESPQPHEPVRRQMAVDEAFRVIVPHGAPLADRFRVERFAQWQQSHPEYVYQINQRGLQRAHEQSIDSQRILDFLRQQAKSLPSNVETALMRYGAPLRT
jgi:hypothetical protein